jgi:hypothetical protein
MTRYGEVYEVVAATLGDAAATAVSTARSQTVPA